MEVFFLKLVTRISFFIMEILDVFEGLFRAFAGLEQINAGSNESFDVLSAFLNNQYVGNVAGVILLISVFCLGIFTIAGIIKAVVNNKKSQGKVIGTFMGAFITFFIAQFVVLGGIMVSSAILGSLNESLENSTGRELTIS
ncbi:MAG: hypothetical protein LBU04_06540, partial [Christensenellaceae bacterium]|nr:hypothetical protein [Christensenellaceae bacterium]